MRKLQTNGHGTESKEWRFSAQNINTTRRRQLSKKIVYMTHLNRRYKRYTAEHEDLKSNETQFQFSSLRSSSNIVLTTNSIHKWICTKVWHCIVASGESSISIVEFVYLTNFINKYLQCRCKSYSRNTLCSDYIYICNKKKAMNNKWFLNKYIGVSSSTSILLANNNIKSYIATITKQWIIYNYYYIASNWISP